MITKVKIEDYKEEIHKKQILYAMVGIHLPYQALVLMAKAEGLCKTKEGNFDIADGIRLQMEDEKYWEAYFKTLNDKK